MKIGIISPSNNFLKEFPNRRETGIRNLKDIGIDVVFSNNAIRENNPYSKSVEERLKEFNEMIDTDIDLLMASMGGYTSIQLLDKIDYSKINTTICGFSDITNLLLAIHTKTKKEVLYGPVYTVNLCDYGGIDEYTKNSLFDIIDGKELTCSPANYTIESIEWDELEKKKIIKKKELKENDWLVVNKGTANGKLIGGNLTSILLILGTEYLPIDEFNNKVLFLEDCDTNISEFCSYLESLRLKKVLDRVNGIIFGKFNTDEMNLEIQEFLKDYMKNLNIPVACNLDFGHVFPILTLPIGRNASLECNEDVKLKIKRRENRI